MAEVLSDLPSLDKEQLLLVKGLEEACDGRAEILDEIDRLLAAASGQLESVPAVTGVEETASVAPEPLVRKVSRTRPVRAHRERRAETPPPSAATSPAMAAEPKAVKPPRAPRRPGRPTVPAPAGHPASVESAAPAAGSAELMDQMGGLLARNEERRTPMQAAWPMPELVEFDQEDAAAPVGIDEPPDVGSNRKGGRNARRVRGGTPAAAMGPSAAPGQGALIVPGDGRRSKGPRRRGRRLLAAVVVLAVAGAGGTVYWRRSHKAATAAAIRPSAALVGALVNTIPDYVPSPGSTVAATPVALATAVQDYGSSTAGAVAAQPTGFLAGVQRRWTNPTDASQAVWVFVMEFENPTLASTFATQVAAATTAAANQVTTAHRHQAAGAAQSTFDTTGVTGAAGSTNSMGRLAFARDSFTKGNYVAEVVVNGPANAGVVAVAQRVAAAQYAALPGH